MSLRREELIGEISQYVDIDEMKEDFEHFSVDSLQLYLDNIKQCMSFEEAAEYQERWLEGSK